jgi:molybdenum cofactor cytidylyltransferase
MAWARASYSRVDDVIAAVILAAGESRRMGSPKPLLRLGDTTFLERLVGQFLASRARPVVVVLGHEAERIRSQVCLDDALVVVNPDYRQGMLSSIRVGLQALQGEPVAGVLICPADLPDISTAVVDLVIGQWEETRAPIVVPVCTGRRGHPVLFARALFEELLKAPNSVGARQVMWDHAAEVTEVPTEERGIIMDIDTPEEFEDLSRRKKRGTHSS